MISAVQPCGRKIYQVGWLPEASLLATPPRPYELHDENSILSTAVRQVRGISHTDPPRVRVRSNPWQGLGVAARTHKSYDVDRPSEESPRHLHQHCCLESTQVILQEELRRAQLPVKRAGYPRRPNVTHCQHHQNCATKPCVRG